MKPKHLYLALCIAGALIPYWAFIPWVAGHGLHLRLILSELFVNRISTFFALDVLVSSLVVIIFLRLERKRLQMRFWWAVLIALVCVGVSLALPLLLYFRERALESQNLASPARA